MPGFLGSTPTAQKPVVITTSGATKTGVKAPRKRQRGARSKLTTTPQAGAPVDGAMAPKAAETAGKPTNVDIVRDAIASGVSTLPALSEKLSLSPTVVRTAISSLKSRNVIVAGERGVYHLAGKASQKKVATKATNAEALSN